MKKNVTWMIETATDWEDFSSVLERGLEQLQTIKDWQEIERERDRATDTRERDNRERNQPQWTRQRDWRCPTFQIPTLPEEPNSNQFKRY